MSNRMIENKIKDFKRKFIFLNELEELYQVKSYHDLVELVNFLENEKILEPIRTKSNLNGKVPSLYLKYRIVEDKNKKISLESEIKSLAPYFAIGKYLSNMDKYIEHREILLDLDYFFKHHFDKLKVKLSKNERAFQIWRYEKMLDSSLAKSVIVYNDLADKLNYYLTPEPFFDYIPAAEDNMNILVIENKDTWYTLRKLMNENQKNNINLLGVTIHGLLYGEGNKITKENAIYEYEHNVINKNIHFYYWGDIDFSGIDLFERVKKANVNCDIKLFHCAYIKMLELSERIELKNILKNQHKVDGTIFFHELNNEKISGTIKNILEQNKYIPQEILNYEELKKIII